MILDLIRQIVASQERFHAKATVYGKVVLKYGERFGFGLSDDEDMEVTSLFSEKPSKA